jgi:hypothetical protein
LGITTSWPGYENARSHLRASFSGSRRKGVLTMNAKYSTSGSDTWIIDVMDNDTVITSAEADSEENAMAMARTSAHAFYGSRAAMFKYAVDPPSPRATKSKGTTTAGGRGFVQNTTDKRPALAEWKARVAENLPACSRLGPHEHSGGIQDALEWQLLRTSQVCVAKLARYICHNGRNEVCFCYGCSCENKSDLL